MTTRQTTDDSQTDVGSKCICDP